MARTRYIAGLAVALGLLLALRLPFVRCGTFGSDVPNFNDESHYVSLARSLAAGDTFTDTAWPYTRAPGASLLLLGLARLRHLPPEQVVCDFQAVQIGLWAALLLLLAALTAALFDRRTALVAALLLAIWPETALLALLIYSETLFCAALLVAVAALLTYRRRRYLGWLALAGLAAGLGALARPTMLTLLPVLALWAGWPAERPSATSRIPAHHPLPAHVLRFALRPAMPAHVRFSVLPAALIILCTAAIVAPWTIRNYLAYGGLIVVDTTGPVNLWISNSPAERGTILSAIHDASSNPVERQRFASRQAWATIAADPGRFAAKAARESLGAWAPRDFAVRRDFWATFLQRPRTATLLAQLDSLLTILMPLALLGLLFAPHTAPGAHAFRLAMVGLAGCYTLMMALTHFEGRYRTPFLVLLLPYAAWCPAHPCILLAAIRRPAGYAALALTLALGIHFAPLLWPAQWQNAQALAFHARGLLRERWGNAAGALADQRIAAGLEPTLDEARVAVAQLLADSGDRAGAQQELRALLDTARTNGHDAPNAVVALQKILLAQDRPAEAAGLDAGFSIPGRRQAEALIWQQGAAPVASLRLGANDVGLTEGFYSSQQGDQGPFRWSRPNARVLLAGPGRYACLQLTADRPLDLPAPTIYFSAVFADHPTPEALGQARPPRRGWASVCVPLPANHSPVPFELRLHMDDYNPRLSGRGGDARHLGVAVSTVLLRDDPATLDPDSGLLLERATLTNAPPAANLQLVGITGQLDGRPGTNLPLTLWWRGAQAPPTNTFTFVHLLDPSGATVAAYNAPFATGQLPSPWAAGEPLPDQITLSLPAALSPGAYQLQAGAFDPATGNVLVTADLGSLQIAP